MSSSYHAICLGHDPALVVNLYGGDSYNVEAAMTLAQSDTHRDCDLMVSRYSGALVEIGCPVGCRYHPRDTEWVDVMWLRVAVLAVDVQTPQMTEAFKRLHPCFRSDRIRRLRPLLIEEKDDS